jgi:protein gp37
MAETTKISRCDATVNPWWGCTKVSPGCANCYANAFLKRCGKSIWGEGQPREDHLVNSRKLAMTLQCKAFKEGKRLRVFCASMADWLYDEVPVEWLAELLDFIQQTPQLDWLLLTKRPESFKPRMRMAARVKGHGGARLATQWGIEGNPPSNVWIGTTLEDQQRTIQRIPALLDIPARVRFLSCEPLLEPVTLPTLSHIHWVIVGGESGPHFRAFDPDWARKLRDDCRKQGVAYFMKQMGGFRPSSMPPIPDDLMIREFPTT